MINVVENNPYRILGVYANSPKRDVLANEGKVKAFLKVGRAVSFPLDLNGLLPNVNRTEASVVQAKSDLSLPQEQLKYAMFWFLNITPIDKIAFNHLFAGNMDEAVELWKKKECLSSMQNRLVCYLLKGKHVYAAGVADRLYLKYGSDFCNLISPTLRFSHEDFVNKFFNTLESEPNVDLSSFSWERCSQLWKDTLNGRLVSPVISQIEACINKAKGVQRNSPSARYDAGVALMNDTKPLITKLKKVCASSDMRYQNVMDKLANEILQCGIDYYNGANDDDKGEKAMPLQKYALQIAVGPMAKSRCKENVDILQKNIDELPPKEIRKDVEAIIKKLDMFQNVDASISNAMSLLNDCKPILQNIKSVVGTGDSFYLKLSTAVVNAALGEIIKSINNKQSEMQCLNREVSNYNLYSKNPYLKDLYVKCHNFEHRIRSAEEINDDIKEFRKSYKKMLRAAWKVMKRMESFDMEEDFRREKFIVNKETLLDMCNSNWVYTSLFAFLGNISFTRITLWLILIATGFLIYVLNV